MKFKVGDRVRYKDYEGIGEILVDDTEEEFRFLINTDEYGYRWFTADEVFSLTSCDDIEEVRESQCDDNDNQNKHMQVCERLNSIYVSKNKDYGNSFGEQYQEYGITSSVIRLDDKMRRLKQITKNGAKVEDETIEDTLLDLANYAILTLMELAGQDE